MLKLWCVRYNVYLSFLLYLQNNAILKLEFSRFCILYVVKNNRLKTSSFHLPLFNVASKMAAKSLKMLITPIVDEVSRRFLVVLDDIDIKS